MLDFSTGYGADALALNQIIDISRGSYVIDGCQLTNGTNAMDVDVTSGNAVVNNTEYPLGNTTITLDAAGSNPRKDVIYIDSTGSVSVVKGSPASAEPTGEVRERTYKPAPPDMSDTESTVLGEVWVGANTSEITAEDVRDRRTFSNSERVNGSSIETDIFSNTSSGRVANGNLSYIDAIDIDDGESIEVTFAVLVDKDTREAVPTGIDLVLATSSSSEGAVLSGDGVTVYDGEDVSTIYSNTSGNTQQIMIGVDNGHYNTGSGSRQDVHAGYIARKY